MGRRPNSCCPGRSVVLSANSSAPAGAEDRRARAHRRHAAHGGDPNTEHKHVSDRRYGDAQRCNSVIPRWAGDLGQHGRRNGPQPVGKCPFLIELQHRQQVERAEPLAPFRTQVLPTDHSGSVTVSDVSGLVGVRLSVSVLSVAAYACPPAHTRTRFGTVSSGGRRPGSHQVV